MYNNKFYLSWPELEPSTSQNIDVDHMKAALIKNDHHITVLQVAERLNETQTTIVDHLKIYWLH